MARQQCRADVGELRGDKSRHVAAALYVKPKEVLESRLGVQVIWNPAPQGAMLKPLLALPEILEGFGPVLYIRELHLQ